MNSSTLEKEKLLKSDVGNATNELAKVSDRCRLFFFIYFLFHFGNNFYLKIFIRQRHVVDYVLSMQRHRAAAKAVSNKITLPSLPKVGDIENKPKVLPIDLTDAKECQNAGIFSLQLLSTDQPLLSPSLETLQSIRLRRGAISIFSGQTGNDNERGELLRTLLENASDDEDGGNDLAKKNVDGLKKGQTTDKTSRKTNNGINNGQACLIIGTKCSEEFKKTLLEFTDEIMVVEPNKKHR